LVGLLASISVPTSSPKLKITSTGEVGEAINLALTEYSTDCAPLVEIGIESTAIKVVVTCLFEAAESLKLEIIVVPFLIIEKDRIPSSCWANHSIVAI
jgi:hypothetical protein